MAEWHITPEYIFDNWTDEMLGLMCRKLCDRKEREAKAWKGEGKVSEDELFSKMRGMVKVVKKKR